MCVFCSSIALALRWGVTHVGDYHYWHCSPRRGIPLSGTRRVREDDTRERSLLRRKPTCGFDIYFEKHVLEFLILIYVLIKRDVTTLGTIVI